MKRGGGLHPARPDCWPPTKRPRAAACGGTPPSSSPAGRPSISSLMVRRGGRYGSMRVIGMVLLCETLCSFAPSLAPCSPHPPRPVSSLCPSCVSACPAAVVFFGSVLAILAAPARPACAPCSSPCYPGPAALRPLFRLRGSMRATPGAGAGERMRPAPEQLPSWRWRLPKPWQRVPRIQTWEGDYPQTCPRPYHGKRQGALLV